MIKLYYQIADISAYHLKSKELIQSSMEYIVKYFGSNHQYWLKYIELLKVVLQLSNEKVDVFDAKKVSINDGVELNMALIGKRINDIFN